MKTDQKLVIIDGIINGGKTLVFNLLKNEDSFIFLDISNHHFELFYKTDTIHQIGEENTESLLEDIKNTRIFLPNVFMKHIGSLMQKFPDYNFVIKPGYYLTALKHYYKTEEFQKGFYNLMPIKYENMYNLYVIRHPKMAWITQPMNKILLKDFISMWSKKRIIEYLFAYDLVKIEDIKNHKLLNSLITKTDLNKVKSYTNFDLQVKRDNLIKKNGPPGYDSINEKMKIIEKELEPLFKAMKYDLNDDNILSFMAEDLNEVSEKINWAEK